MNTRAPRSASLFQRLDFIPPLLIRFYLGLTLLAAGFLRLNSEAFLRPHPLILDFIVYGEIALGFLLMVGLLSRLSSFVILVTAIVAAVHMAYPVAWFVFVQPLPPSHHLSDLTKDLQMINFWIGNPRIIFESGIMGATTFMILLMTLLITGGGRYLSLDYYLRGLFEKKPSIDPHRLYVGNLDYNMDRNGLRDLFKKFGDLTDVRLIRGKCYGFVTFKEVDDARAAQKEMSGKVVNGRTLSVSPAKVKPH